MKIIIMNNLFLFAITMLVNSCCDSESAKTPSELRDEANRIEQKEQIKKQEKMVCYCNFNRNCDSFSSCIDFEDARNIAKGKRNGAKFFENGHYYRVWYGASVYKAWMGIVHDPDCEINDMRKIK